MRLNKVSFFSLEKWKLTGSDQIYLEENPCENSENFQDILSFTFKRNIPFSILILNQLH